MSDVSEIKLESEVNENKNKSLYEFCDGLKKRLRRKQKKRKTSKNDFSSSLGSSDTNIDKEPIQLVTVNETGEFELNPDALNFISQIEGPLGVIIAVGPYKSGKSFFMNRMQGRSKGFPVGTSSDGFKGIWMSNKPIRKFEDGRELNILLMDTEGLDAPNNNPEYDRKLFILSYLISSVFIYNSKQLIDRDSIKKLSNATYFANEVANIETENKPDFIWVLQDCFLDIEKSEIDYLAEALRMKPANAQSDKDDSDRDLIEDTIIKAFSIHDLVKLPLPIKETKNTSIDDSLQKLGKLNHTHLNPEFKIEMKKLSNLAKEILNPKRNRESEFNGASFKEFLIETVKKINSNKILSIRDDSIAKMELIAENILIKVKSAYAEKFQKFLKNNPYPNHWDKFYEEHEKIEKELTTALKSELSFLPEDSQNKYLEMFRNHLYNADFDKTNFTNLNGGLLYLYYIENKNEIRKVNRHKLHDLWNKNVTFKLQNNSFSSLMEFNKVKDGVIDNYYLTALGDTNDMNNVLDEFLETQNMLQTISRINQFAEARTNLCLEGNLTQEKEEEVKEKNKKLEKKKKENELEQKQQNEEAESRKAVVENMSLQIKTVQDQLRIEKEQKLDAQKENQTLIKTKQQKEVEEEEFIRQSALDDQKKHQSIEKLEKQQQNFKQKLNLQEQEYENAKQENEALKAKLDEYKNKKSCICTIS